jgi:hypothetical protein
LETWRRHYQHNSNILAVVLVTWIFYELRNYNLKSREIRKIKKDDLNVLFYLRLNFFILLFLSFRQFAQIFKAINAGFVTVAEFKI